MRAYERALAGERVFVASPEGDVVMRPASGKEEHEGRELIAGIDIAAGSDESALVVAEREPTGKIRIVQAFCDFDPDRIAKLFREELLKSTKKSERAIEVGSAEHKRGIYIDEAQGFVLDEKIQLKTRGPLDAPLMPKPAKTYFKPYVNNDMGTTWIIEYLENGTPLRAVQIDAGLMREFVHNMQRRNRPKPGEDAVRVENYRELFDSNPDYVWKLRADTRPVVMPHAKIPSGAPNQDEGHAKKLGHACLSSECCGPECPMFVYWMKDLLPIADSSQLDIVGAFFGLKRAENLNKLQKEPEADVDFRARIETAFAVYEELLKRCAMTCPGGSERKGCECSKPTDCPYAKSSSYGRHEVMALQAGALSGPIHLHGQAAMDLAKISMLIFDDVPEPEIDTSKSSVALKMLSDAEVACAPKVVPYKQPRTQARYPSKCPLCPEQVIVGDTIEMVEGGQWAHRVCADRQRDAAKLTRRGM